MKDDKVYLDSLKKILDYTEELTLNTCLKDTKHRMPVFAS